MMRNGLESSPAAKKTSEEWSFITCRTTVFIGEKEPSFLFFLFSQTAPLVYGRVYTFW